VEWQRAPGLYTFLAERPSGAGPHRENVDSEKLDLPERKMNAANIDVLFLAPEAGGATIAGPRPRQRRVKVAALALHSATGQPQNAV
jgi:hypothetical protein